jgi:hypothetical protein
VRFLTAPRAAAGTEAALNAPSIKVSRTFGLTADAIARLTFWLAISPSPWRRPGTLAFADIGRKRRRGCLHGFSKSHLIAVDLTARTYGKLFRPILLIPSWEGPADPEEKRGSCERHHRYFADSLGHRTAAAGNLFSRRDWGRGLPISFCP